MNQTNPTPAPIVRHEIIELRGRGRNDQPRTRRYDLPTGIDQRFHTYRIVRRCADGELFIYGLSGQAVPSGMVLRPMAIYCCVARRDHNEGFVDRWASLVADAPLPEGFCDTGSLPGLIGRTAHTRDD